MPLMAGSPGLSLPKGGGCSGGVARQGGEPTRLYSGGDERCVRGRSAYQRGLCTSPRVGEEDEGRDQRVVANGRAKNKRSLHIHAKVWLGETVGHDRVARGGAHQVQV